MRPERRWNIQSGNLRGVAAARREFALHLCAKRAGAAERYDAALIFGELVGNAVKCARNQVSVELLEDEWAALRVVDDGDCFDDSLIGPATAESESGRGLYIASTLAREMHVHVGERFCEITAVLPIKS